MKNISRHLPTVARVFLGLIFFVFGLNGFLHFIPNPTEVLPDRASAFLGGLMGTGYLFPLLKGVEVIAGFMLLSNRFVPLALALLAPIIVNIVAFHTLLVPSGVAIALVVLVLEVFLAWSYREVYRPMLAARVRLGDTTPASSKKSRSVGDHATA
jgi:uncharacterized membrane protein YphA (DoxX/SURF4 family)